MVMGTSGPQLNGIVPLLRLDRTKSSADSLDIIDLA